MRYDSIETIDFNGHNFSAASGNNGDFWRKVGGVWTPTAVAIAQQNSYDNWWIYDKFSTILGISATNPSGALKLLSTVSGGTVTSELTANTDEFGVVVLSTSTAATNYAGISSANAGNSATHMRLANSGGRTFLFELDLNVPLIPDGINIFNTVMGFANNVNNPTDGAYFGFSAQTGNLIGVVRNNLAQTVTGTIFTVPNNSTDRINLKIELSAARARFIVNNGTPVDITTGLPLGRAFGYGASVIKSQGNTARTLRLYGMGVGNRP